MGGWNVSDRHEDVQTIERDGVAARDGGRDDMYAGEFGRDIFGLMAL